MNPRIFILIPIPSLLFIRSLILILTFLFIVLIYIYYYYYCYYFAQVSVAIGCAVRDRNVVFASTFATFFSRAFDQLRMAAISESNINLCGSHCGVSIGQ